MNFTTVVLFIIIWLGGLLFTALLAIHFHCKGWHYIRTSSNKKEIFNGVINLIISLTAIICFLFIATTPYLVAFVR